MGIFVKCLKCQKFNLFEEFSTYFAYRCSSCRTYAQIWENKAMIYFNQNHLNISFYMKNNKKVLFMKRDKEHYSEKVISREVNFYLDFNENSECFRYINTFANAYNIFD